MEVTQSSTVIPSRLHLDYLTIYLNGRRRRASCTSQSLEQEQELAIAKGEEETSINGKKMDKKKKGAAVSHQPPLKPFHLNFSPNWLPSQASRRLTPFPIMQIVRAINAQM